MNKLNSNPKAPPFQASFEQIRILIRQPDENAPTN
jgi:hypothetical protein